MGKREQTIPLSGTWAHPSGLPHLSPVWGRGEMPGPPVRHDTAATSPRRDAQGRQSLAWAEGQPSPVARVSRHRTPSTQLQSDVAHVSFMRVQCNLVGPIGGTGVREVRGLPRLTPDLFAFCSRVPPQILHIPLLANLQNGLFKAQAKRYKQLSHENTGQRRLQSSGCQALPQPGTGTFSFHAHCSCVISGRAFGQRPGSGRALGKQE